MQKISVFLFWVGTFWAVGLWAADNAATRPATALAGAAAIAGHASNSAAEDWKGKPEPSEFSVGFLSGLGIVDSHAGLSVMGTVSRKLSDPGFVGDINNAVSIELFAGPLLAAGSASIFYSAHLRWDFRKTSDWGLYAVGGLAGYTASTSIGNPFEFFPRFGIGMLWKLQDNLALRTEVSHELLAVGLNFPL